MSAPQTGTTTHVIPSADIDALLATRDAVMEKVAAIRKLWDEAIELANSIRLVEAPEKIVGTHLPQLRVRGMNSDIDFEVGAIQAEFEATCWSALMRGSGILTFMNAAARAKWDDQTRHPQRRRDRLARERHWQHDRTDELPVLHGDLSALRPDELPPLTHDNVLATFAHLHMQRADFMVDGIVDLFRRLSWHYKTNCPQMFGKRIILTYFLDRWGHLNHDKCNTLDDLMRVFSICDQKPEADAREGVWSQVNRAMGGWSHLKDATKKEWANEYVSIRYFKNGNAHITFLRPDLIVVLNRVIAQRFPNALAAVVD